MITKIDVLPTILTAAIPGLEWDVQDDLCDCTFQRVGFWTNPYIGATLRMRLCCLWKELSKQYPDLILEVPSFYNYNTHEYEAKLWEWDGEFDMPRAIWYRHLATKTGRPLAEIRQEYADKEPPKAVPKKARPVWRLR